MFTLGDNPFPNVALSFDLTPVKVSQYADIIISKLYYINSRLEHWNKNNLMKSSSILIQLKNQNFCVGSIYILTFDVSNLKLWNFCVHIY